MDVLPFFDTLIIIIGTQNAFTIQLKKKRLSFSKYEQLMIGASITEVRFVENCYYLITAESIFDFLIDFLITSDFWFVLEM
uniref:Uncharacterized protein n=1 Tax=Wuchereria bancrofti TaxID=6293 RepID=A0A1I8ETC0_WUCBA